MEDNDTVTTTIVESEGDEHHPKQQEVNQQDEKLEEHLAISNLSVNDNGNAQQQDSHSNPNEQYKLSVDSETLVKGINIDETLNKKQKEREERLASMMSHYHKKYENGIPSVDNAPLQSDALVDDDDDDLMSEAAKQRRAEKNSRKKDLLAEQMKKYQDQYQSILSDVNSILSNTPPSLSSGSSPVYSPIMSSSDPLSLSSASTTLNSAPTSANTSSSNLHESASQTATNTNTTSADGVAAGDQPNFNQVPILPLGKGKKKKNKQQQQQIQQQEDNLLSENIDSTAATTTTTTTTSSSNEGVAKQLSPDQQRLQQMIMQQQILFFEKDAIPYLSNVGFTTLKSVEMDSLRCAESVVTLTRNLNYSLMVMSRMSVELFNNLKMSNDMLCFTIGGGVGQTETLIKKCMDLNEQAKSMAQLHQKIKQIREYVDKLDGIVHNVVKQLDKQ